MLHARPNSLISLRIFFDASTMLIMFVTFRSPPQELCQRQKQCRDYWPSLLSWRYYLHSEKKIPAELVPD